MHHHPQHTLCAATSKAEIGFCAGKATGQTGYVDKGRLWVHADCVSVICGLLLSHCLQDVDGESAAAAE